MPIVPGLIERTTFLTLNQGPSPMLDMWSGPAFWSVQAALQLDLFATLAAGSLSAPELACAAGADPRGIKLLLDTLTALGYVKLQGGRYANTAMTSKWLLPSGALDLKPFFLYWGAIMEHFMPRLADSVRRGGDMGLYSWLDTQPEVAHHFQAGMVQLARFIAADVARTLYLPPHAERLLDVGGGHAEYSIALCREHPNLRAVILDRDRALVSGRAAVAAAEMGDRIESHTGDFLRQDLPGGFDVALVFNIVHGLTPAQNVELLRKVRAALNPNGQIVVLEQVVDASPLPLFNTVAAILSLAYYHLIGGQVYSTEEMYEWLAAAGFVNVQHQRIAKAASALFTATRA